LPYWRKTKIKTDWLSKVAFGRLEGERPKSVGGMPLSAGTCNERPFGAGQKDVSVSSSRFGHAGYGTEGARPVFVILSSLAEATWPVTFLFVAGRSRSI
jgi:hypothetical protein